MTTDLNRAAIMHDGRPRPSLFSLIVLLWRLRLTRLLLWIGRRF
jgi:hypothetical protein